MDRVHSLYIYIKTSITEAIYIYTSRHTGSVQSVLRLPCGTVFKFNLNTVKDFAADFRSWLWRLLTPRYRISCPISVAYVVAKNPFETEALFKIEIAYLRGISRNSETDGSILSTVYTCVQKKTELFKQLANQHRGRATASERT